MKLTAVVPFFALLQCALGISVGVDNSLFENKRSKNSQLKAPTDPVVKTPDFEVEGVMSNITSLPAKMFLGIPYATPPVGDQRFLRPTPKKYQNSTIKAKTQPPGCIQFTYGPFPWYDNMTGKSEDCLYLNVYAPVTATNGSKLAVIFWIYGGGFTLGSNRMDVYDARAWASKEGIIVVTINYRLGAFGFLTSGTEDAPGNMGLYDQLTALRWVNKYIEYFGGDKDRIAVVGESGGSSSTSMMCVSPLTKGLFSRAILESATVISRLYNSVDFNKDLAEKVAEKIGCATKDSKTIYNSPTEVVQCLRDKDAMEIAKAVASFNPYSTESFKPQYGDDYLPTNPVNEIRKGCFHNMSILAGVNTDEGSFFLTSAYYKELGFFGEKDTKVNKTFATTILKGAFANYTDPQKYVDFYLKGVSDTDYDKLRRQAYTALGDTGLVCPTVYFAETYAKKNNDVYFYFFNHRPSKTPWSKWMGVVHFDEVQFVFGRPVRVPQEYTQLEVGLSSRMLRIWANFAKDGNPGRVEQSTVLGWPKYSEENPTYLTLDTESFGKLGKGPHRENCDFLRSHYGF